MNIYNYKEVNQDVATSGQPSEEELNQLAMEGVDCIVNIAPRDQRYSLANEKKITKELSMEYIFYPINWDNPTLDDFLKFEEIMDNIYDKRVLIHCAANYRVSALYSHYAMKNLGWSQAECNDFIASIWNIGDFPVWDTYSQKLKKYIKISKASAKTISKIVNLIQTYLVVDEDDQFDVKGRKVLTRQVEYFVNKKEKLEFILPGFPCKSPNIADKTFSDMPDYGEVMAIQQIDKFASQLNEIYAPGSSVTILSDGTTFADIVHVDDNITDKYNHALRDITVTENINWANLSTILPEQIKKLKHKTQDNIRKALLKSIDKGPDSFGKFIKKVDDNKALTETYDKLCSYLYHDMCLGCCVDEDRDKYLKSISNKAYKMMYRGKALNSGIENHFYKHIRLSVHQYDNSGPKFTFNLTGSIKAIAPWHSVPVRLLDGTFTLMTHFIAKDKVLAKVTYEKNNWLYLEVTDPKLTEFTYEVIKKPRFGLKITANSYGYDSFSAEYLQKLSEDFGFVLLKNAPYEEQSELVNFTEKFGDIYQWDFGSVHVVKPEKEPKGFVHSIEKTPLHWDLSMLPLDHEMVANNEYFAATTFMLYCKTPPQKGEGQTTIVDSRIALKIAGQEKVALWKKTNVTYETKMTYFGGTPRIYPLVFKHPHNNDYILRYQEGSNLDLQKFELSSDQIPPTDFSEMVEDVNNIAYDERCLIAHVWEAGDLVIIDNNYTLHGRLSMTEKSMARELWRVQVF